MATNRASRTLRCKRCPTGNKTSTALTTNNFNNNNKDSIKDLINNKDSRNKDLIKAKGLIKAFRIPTRLVAFHPRHFSNIFLFFFSSKQQWGQFGQEWQDPNPNQQFY